MFLRNFVLAGLVSLSMMMFAGTVHAYGNALAYSEITAYDGSFGGAIFEIEDMFYDWRLAGQNQTFHEDVTVGNEHPGDGEDFWYQMSFARLVGLNDPWSGEIDGGIAEIYDADSETSAFAEAWSQEDEPSFVQSVAWVRKTAVINVTQAGSFEFNGSYYGERSIDADDSLLASADTWGRLDFGGQQFVSSEDIAQDWSENFISGDIFLSGDLMPGRYEFTMEVYADASLGKRQDTAAVPEPASILLLGLGGAGLALRRRFQKNA